jgi:hypothetical protein
MSDNKIEPKLEVINALAISLLSLSEAYEIPEAIKNVIHDLNNQIDGLSSLI